MAHILVIDDEDLVRHTLREMLESAGHRVSEAENGNEGLRRFTEAPADLVITDIIMPEKEGVETIQILLRQHPGLKVIAISGGGRTGNFDYLALAKKLGANRILKKPFRKSELLEAVDACLDGAP
jgi:YesN/AraC family two-component response regulator